ncbi:hypothetical protein [Vibrio cholerae]|uniref:hypothetical protein n=1 Tax=Vibrio cholerae TaxID=666 RepID=UPI001E2BCC9D|nr:hypothetical protein [Vibrio cholerae]MCD6725331.1 hypothetical protein [Vibrio cholerae]HDZ9627033.1 hypothetical protein [Vibrio cholerae]
MKNLYNYIRSVDTTLNALLLISLVSIVLTDTLFNNLPELFDGGAGLLNAYYNFCIGMVVSYIFYFVVVHIKELKDKENIDAYVAGKSMAVIHDYESVIRAIQNKLNITSDELYPSKSEVQRLFAQIDPNSDAPMVSRTSRSVNWLQFMDSYRFRSQKVISKIFEKMPFLDSEHVKLLSAVDDCSHFMVIEYTSRTPTSNQDLSAWASTFYDYSIACKQLNLYNQRFE